VILAFAAFWYGLLPVIGAFSGRRAWRRFRQRFGELRLRPLLDYAAYRHGEGGEYRFIGGFESVTDGHTLWIRSAELTVPVALTGAQTYVLPMPPESAAGPTAGPTALTAAESAGLGFPADRGNSSGKSAVRTAIYESFDPGKETPQRIQWEQLTSLAEGAKVFVGGALVSKDDRLTFVPAREKPLMVIFYDGPDRSLAIRTIRAGRQGNEYWNHLTPYALAMGAFCQVLMILAYIQRPVFQLTVIAAFAAMFIPLFPLIPPGLVFTVFYRRLWWRGRVYRAYRDLARLPLRYFPDSAGPPEDTIYGELPNGEQYAGVVYQTLPEEVRARIESGEIPLLIPEKEAGKNEPWYVFGARATDAHGREGGIALPSPPRDVFATYGAVPGNPEKLARRFTRKAYTLETISWLLLLAGIALNAVCIAVIVLVLS
jgi:hypothetical protein